MDIFLLKLVCRLLSYVPLVARKPTKYTDKNLKSSPTFRRHAAVPSVNRESVWKTYDTAWLSKISLINADYGLFWEDLFSLKGYTFIFGTQVCANLRRGGIDPNRRSQNTNQRKRKCLLWHGSIFAKEKRVSAIFHTSTFNLAKFNFGVLYLLSSQTLLEFGVGQRERHSPQQPGKVCFRFTPWTEGNPQLEWRWALFSSFRFAYKDEYEKFKLYMTIILMFGAITCLFFLNYR